jgi:hypothetical protein
VEEEFEISGVTQNGESNMKNTKIQFIYVEFILNDFAFCLE